MGAEQQQSVDFKCWLMFFTSRLCDCALQTSANLQPVTLCSLDRLEISYTFPRIHMSLCVHSFSRIRSHALQNICPAILVQQVVLDSHQNLTNHGSVRVNVCHAIHWSLPILHTVRVLLQSPHRVSQVLHSKAPGDQRNSSP